MKFLSDILAKAGLTVDGVVTLNNTATGQTPDANDNSTKLATTAWVRTFVQPYSLPIASASVLGGVKVGSGLSIDSVTGVLTTSGGGGGNLNFRTIQEFTATAGQTTFTIAGGYNVGYVEVFINGVYISESQYTATNGSTIVLNDPVSHNDIVTVFLFSLYNLGESNYARNVDTLTATAGQTTFSTSYIPGQIDVYYNGSKLNAAEFTATNGSSIVLAQAAVLGDIIEVVTYLAGAGLNANRTLTINGTTYDLTANRTWTLTTSNIAEGTNLYYTDARVSTYLTTNSYATQSYVGTQLANLVASAPSTLDTLNELAAALGNDPSFATTIATSIGTKVPQTRTITINGTAYDLTADRSWTIASGVTSFNTRTGAITAASGDYTTAQVTESGNLYYTDTRVRAAISLTTTGTSGAATYDSATGIFNIPQYQGGVTSFNTRTGAITLSSSDVTTALTYTPVTNARTITINGTSYDLSANRSWTIAPDVSVRNTYAFTATANQTTFTVTGGYTVGLVDVFINGVKLAAADFTATNGTTVVLATGTGVGNIVEIVKYVSAFTTAVETTRTLTINGTTYDLSANRTWSIDNASLGAQPQLNGTGLVRMSGTTVSYDNATYATESYVTTAVSNLVNAAPSTLDTLNELAAALGNDANFATTVTNSIATKLPSSSVSGTTNYLPKFTGTSTIGNSLIQEDTNTIGINTTGYTIGAGYTALGINNATNGGAIDLLLNNVKKGEFYITSTSFNMYGFAGVGINLTVDNNASKGLFLNTSGNLGLGVTPSAWNAVFKVLESGDANNQSTLAFQNNANVIYLTTNSYFDTSWKYKFSDNAGQYLIDGNEHRWYNAPSGTAGNAITFTQAMTLNASGNLGVGTTSILGSSVERTIHLAAPSSGYATLYVTNSANTLKGIFAVADPTSSMFIGSQSNHAFSIVTNDTARLTIASTGAATFSSTVQFGSSTGYTTAAQGQFFSKGGGSMFTANLLSGGWGRHFTMQRNDVTKFHIGVDGSDNFAIMNSSDSYLMTLSSIGAAQINSTVQDYTLKVINTNAGNNAGLLIKAGVNNGNEILNCQKGNGSEIFKVDVSGEITSNDGEMYFKRSAFSHYGHIYMGSNNHFYIRNSGGYNMYLQTNNVNQITLQNDGTTVVSNLRTNTLYTEFSKNLSGAYSSGTYYKICDSSELTASGIYIIVAYVDTFAIGGGVYFCTFASVPFYWFAGSSNSSSVQTLPTMLGTGHHNLNPPIIRIRLDYGVNGAKQYLEFDPNANWSNVQGTGGATVTFYVKRIGS